MGIQESLAKRRTYYNINKELPVAEADVIALVENTTELVPDAFNMKSARVIVATKEKQDALWDAIYDAFGGKVAREKIDSFKAGYGTLQISIWTALRELNIGANLQHYNPVIDETVKKMFGVPDSWKLIAQMPFGGIAAEPQAKDKEDIKARVKVFN
ncbi:nitroreductase family protein [Mitsuokella multacida]|uniref:nitroreductase family protein n=1 Tax=Mitsuokella multacida TaxID=52226 RepID=UPI002657FCE8|nr:nitroreductase family protein [Mitsuokella multacida]